MGIDKFSTAVPGWLPFRYLDALANKQAADRAFDFDDTTNELLAVFDQRSVFSHLVLWHVNPSELSHYRQSRQFERVVFVRLAFDVLSLPGRVVGAADKRLETQFLAQVANPPAGTTRFHYDQVNLVILKDGREIHPCRRHCLKTIFLLRRRGCRACIVFGDAIRSRVNVNRVLHDVRVAGDLLPDSFLTGIGFQGLRTFTLVLS